MHVSEHRHGSDCDIRLLAKCLSSLISTTSSCFSSQQEMCVCVCVKQTDIVWE